MKIIFTFYVACLLTAADYGLTQVTNAPLLSVEQLIDKVKVSGYDSTISVRSANRLGFPDQSKYPCKEIDDDTTMRSLYVLTFNAGASLVIAHATAQRKGWLLRVEQSGEIRHVLLYTPKNSGATVIDLLTNSDSELAPVQLEVEKQFWSNWLATNSPSR